MSRNSRPSANGAGRVRHLRTPDAAAVPAVAGPAARVSPGDVRTHPGRDALLTVFGRATLADRYLLPGESSQDLFARVAAAFADDAAHAQRLYHYMSRLWFMPATPILANGGAARGLPISCFLMSVSDDFEGVLSAWNRMARLSAVGGGVGVHWGGVRSIGESTGASGESPGVIPFIRVLDSLVLATGQGSVRRGAACVYLDVEHPEIEEFVDLRKATGDLNRRALNLHHGVNITDEFMRAVRDGDSFALKSPTTGAVVRTIDARTLWQKLLETRVQTGEPYLIFIDTVNRAMPQHQQQLGLRVQQSNLCSEIVLPTGRDHLGAERAAVCCLSSVNAETFLEWAPQEAFVEDVMRFLDNVLESFIQDAPPSMTREAYAVVRERSVGLGLMGLHSFLQSQGVAFESPLAKAWNRRVFRHLRAAADAASHRLALERGPCPDARETGVMERFSHKLAVAPTASISIICGDASPGIEPRVANIYVHKTLSGSFLVKNRHLARLLRERGEDNEATWLSILEHEGSVGHLAQLSPHEKAVFRTAFEIDQRTVVDLAADRAALICQSQSLNLFMPADVDKFDLHMAHYAAWERGCKSLYYLRSTSVQRVAVPTTGAPRHDEEVCLSCQ